MRDKWVANQFPPPHSFPDNTGKTVTDINPRPHLQVQVPCGGLNFEQARINNMKVAMIKNQRLSKRDQVEPAKGIKLNVKLRTRRRKLMISSMLLELLKRRTVFIQSCHLPYTNALYSRRLDFK